MTDEERNQLLREMERRIEETKTFSAAQAMGHLLSEGFKIDHGELVVARPNHRDHRDT